MTCLYRKDSGTGSPDPNDICVLANADNKILFYCKQAAFKKTLKVPLVSL